jgi:murein DD-endopeptidase MepM/ murein hydrolase activator NlpD
MKKNLFTIIILILIILVSCFKEDEKEKTNKKYQKKKEKIPTINAVDDKQPDNVSLDAIIIDTVAEHFKKELIDTSVIKIDQDKQDTIIKVLDGYQTDSFYVIEGVVKPGQAISHILKDYNVSSSDIYKLDQASKDVFDVRNIQSGKGYTIICKDSNKIAKFFIYQKSKIEYVVYDLDSISVYLGEKEVTIKNNTVSGTIKKGGGLWRSLTRKLEAGKVDPLVDMLANRIYAWTFDFTHIQPEDSFIVHFEELYVNRESIGIGKIHAASFTHKGKTTNAFRFEEQENSPEYFDENGNNLRSSFLVSPLAFTRVSSSFGKRKHPISGKWKNHNGTDYSAKTGTPVMTTAKGTVTHSSWKGGYGNCVIVKHDNKFSTLYAHLSKFESGARKGSYVKQGDIIGYVGSTGYSTGPHLHYEFFVHGKQVDHLKQKLPPSLPLKKENTEAFEKTRNEYLKILENFVK